MISGLPTFGPQFGGPSEIIEDKINGFLMNTSKPKLIANEILKFIENSQKNGKYWDTISENAIKRVKEKFTWDLYSNKLIRLTKLYGFWRYSSPEQGRLKLKRYCDLIYHLLLRKRAEKLY